MSKKRRQKTAPSPPPTADQIDSKLVEELARRPYHRHFWPEGTKWHGVIPELGVRVVHRNSQRMCSKLLEAALRERIRATIAERKEIRPPDPHTQALETPLDATKLQAELERKNKLLQKARGTLLVCKGLLVAEYDDSSWVMDHISGMLTEIQGFGRLVMGLQADMMTDGQTKQLRNMRTQKRWLDDDRKPKPSEGFALAT